MKISRDAEQCEELEEADAEILLLNIKYHLFLIRPHTDYSFHYSRACMTMQERGQIKGVVYKLND